MLIYIGIAYSSLVAGLIGLGFFYVTAILYFVSYRGFFHKEFVYPVLSSNVGVLWYILRNGGFKGRGLYIPTPSGEVKVFLSRDEILTDIPQITESSTPLIVANPPGLLLDPPCKDLLDHLLRMSKLDFSSSDVHILMNFLSKVFDEYDIADSTDYFVEDDRVNIRLTKVLGGGYCNALALRYPGACERFGCPICSVIAAFICLSENSPVLIESVDISGDGSIVEVAVRILR